MKVAFLHEFQPYVHPKCDLNDYIIYDNEGVIALNKPPGLVTMGGFPSEFSVVSGLEQLKDRQWNEKPRLVHRLDRFTSGVLLLARSKGIARNLCNAFQQRQLHKYYWALVDGLPQQTEGLIDDALVQDEMFMGLAPTFSSSAQSAQTGFKLLKASGDQLSFMEFTPHTGRRHQIRVHASHSLGVPILGDQDYHPVYHQRRRLEITRHFAATNISAELNNRIHGQMLHARSIDFMHPTLKRTVTIEAPLPRERLDVWSDLGFDTSESSTCNMSVSF